MLPVSLRTCLKCVLRYLCDNYDEDEKCIARANGHICYDGNIYKGDDSIYDNYTVDDESGNNYHYDVDKEK